MKKIRRIKSFKCTIGTLNLHKDLSLVVLLSRCLLIFWLLKRSLKLLSSYSRKCNRFCSKNLATLWNKWVCSLLAFANSSCFSCLKLGLNFYVWVLFQRRKFISHRCRRQSGRRPVVPRPPLVDGQWPQETAGQASLGTPQSVSTSCATSLVA